MIGHLVGLVHGGRRHSLAEVNRFADRRIAVILKRGLHVDMPPGLDIVGAFENPAHVLRDLAIA